MANPLASEKLIDACCAGDRAAAIMALDEGANPIATWDEDGSPAWWIWLFNESATPSPDIAEVFEVMLDAGLMITAADLPAFVSLIENRSKETAVVLINRLSAPLLDGLLHCQANPYDSAAQAWWAELYAAQHARSLDKSTPARPASPSFPRF